MKFTIELRPNIETYTETGCDSRVDPAGLALSKCSIFHNCNNKNLVSTVP
jgi:hypothetical protein